MSNMTAACSDMGHEDLRYCPGMSPPPGQPSMNPDAQSPESIILPVTVLFLILPSSAIAARLFTKAYLLRNLQAEDSCAASVIKAFDFGSGKHQWDVSMGDAHHLFKYEMRVEILAPFSIFAKVAILLQIKRIFCIHKHDATLWAIWFLIVANLLWFVVPISIYACCWSTWINMEAGSLKKCVDMRAMCITAGSANIASSIAILAFPLLGLSHLQLPWKKKLGVYAVFAIGITGIVTGAARLVNSIKSTDSSDHTHWYAITGLTQLIDFATVIICACAPVFPRIYQFVSRGKGPEPIAPVYSESQEPPTSPPSRVEVIDVLYGWDKAVNSANENEGPYFQLDRTTTVGINESSRIGEGTPKKPCPLKSAVGSILHGKKDDGVVADSLETVKQGAICKTVKVHRLSSDW